MIGLNCWPGYSTVSPLELKQRHQDMQERSIDNVGEYCGSCKLGNSENGVDWLRRSRMITQFYFVIEVRGRQDIYQVTGIILPWGKKKRAAMAACW